MNLTQKQGLKATNCSPCSKFSILARVILDVKAMCVQPALFAFTTHKNVFCTLYRAICC